MGRKLVRTHVSICEEHREWADENNINLSSLVRDAIDERMGE